MGFNVEQLKAMTVAAIDNAGDVRAEWGNARADKALTLLRDELAEAIEYGRFDSEDRDDIVHELADGHVSVYTHDIFNDFVALKAYTEDISELGQPNNMEQAAQWALYIVFERVLNGLLDEVETDDDEL